VALGKNLFGIDPEFAVTINERDLTRYEELYPNLVIILDVRWAGVYLLPVHRALSLIDSGQAKKHKYSNVSPRDGGEIGWVFSTEDMEELSNSSKQKC
jgi:hypothetical protein